MRHCSVCYSELEPGGDLNRHQIPETCVKKLALRVKELESLTLRLAEFVRKKDKRLPRNRADLGSLWRGGHE